MTRTTTPLLQSFELWNRFTADNAAMLWAAGEVIGQRTSRMATHGIAPDANERREMQRMVEEKQTAIFESSLAAWNEWIRLSQASWFDALRTTTRNSLALAPALMGIDPFDALSSTTARSMASMSRQWTTLDTPLRIADAAFEPVRARVAANRKRLAD
jgi:hypothetical protein